MWSFNGIFVVLFLFLPCIYSYKKDYGSGYFFKHDPNQKYRENAEKLTNTRIRSALGTPGNGTIFPPTFTVHNLDTKFSGATLYFSEMQMYGLERFRPLSVKSDFTNLVISISLSLDQVNLLGNFRMNPWIGNPQGTFNFSMIDAWLNLDAELMFLNEGTEEEGLYISEIHEPQITFDELQLEFYHLGFLNTLLQPIKKSLSRYIFKQIKPVLASEAELNFRKLLNKVLTNLLKECPNAVNEVDRALIRARALMKSSQLDPLFMPDHYPKSTKLIKLELTQGKLSGLSSLKRTGPILVGFERDAVYMHLNLGAHSLQGQYTWTWIIWKNLFTNRGLIHFKVEDLVVKVKLEKRVKSEDNSTRVENVEMKIGSVNLLSEGLGAVKYIMETFLNVVPDSFRQKISMAAEYRLLKVIEEEFQKIDLEELVEDDSLESLEAN